MMLLELAVVLLSDFCLSIVSAWALSKLPTEAYFSRYLYCLLFLYCIFSVLRQTHPSVSKYPLNNVCVGITFCVELIAVLHVLCDSLRIQSKLDSKPNQFLPFVDEDKMFFILSVLAALIVMVLMDRRLQWHKLYGVIMGALVVLFVALLIRNGLSYCEGSWTLGLAALLPLNHFVLPRLLSGFISELTINTINLSFLIVFCVQSIAESHCVT